LREGIGLRAMGQRDPLVEYQREGYDMFQTLVGRIRDDFTQYIFHVSTVDEDGQRTRRQAPLRYVAPAKTQDAADAQRHAAPAPQQAMQPASMDGGGGAPPPQQDDGIVYETFKR